MPGGGGKGGGGKGLGGTVNVNADVDANATLDLVGLDDIGVSAELSVPRPIQMRNDLAATTRSEVAITQPIVTEMNASASIDVKPVDLCLTFGIGRLPRARICRPVERHFGMTLFGVEVFGFNWSGYSELVFADLAPRPHLELGGHESVQQRPAAPRRLPTVVGRTRRSALRLRLGD